MGHLCLRHELRQVNCKLDDIFRIRIDVQTEKKRLYHKSPAIVVLKSLKNDKQHCEYIV